MKFRDFGTTGIKVSELIFGGGAVGGLLINQDDDTKLAAIKRAMDAGINWIDTAPSYGQGRSEEAIGWILKEIEEDPYISTKVSIDTSDMTDISGQIQRSVEESLNRLQKESVTLLQLHNWIGRNTKGYMVSSADLLRKGGVLDGLQRIKDQKLVQHFGITALGKTDNIIEVIKDGRIASAQVYYNLLNPSAGWSVPSSWEIYDFSRILDTCEKNGVAALAIRVFSAGVIATDTRHGRETPLTKGDTVESETTKAKSVFNAFGTEYGTRAQTAIRFVLSQEKLSSVIFGLAEMDHLEEAIAAQLSGSLPEEAIQNLKKIYQKGCAR